MTRRRPGQVDHVLYCYWPEGFERAVRFWEEGFGLEFEEIDLAGSGLRIVIDWQAGIEIGAPVGEGGPADRMREHLRVRGEGLRSVIFGVEDMDAAIARVEAAGATVAARTDVSAVWTHRFDSIEEARLDRIVDADILLSEVRLRDEDGR